MYKKIYSCLIIIFFLTIAILLLTNSSTVINSSILALDIFKNNVFPSLFPFFVLSEILINYGFVELLSELFKPIMNRLNISNNASFILVMSLISGYPSNAKYTKELYSKGLINRNDAERILTFTHFSNPLFILGTLAVSFLNNYKVALLILIIHYSTNIIISLIFRNKKVLSNKTKANLKIGVNKMHNARIKNNKAFGTILKESIINSINTLLLILGTLTVFLVITSIINNSLNINPYFKSIISGFFEMTQGLKSVSLLDISLKLKSTLSIMIISFGGISVHMQIISILSDTDISYIPFFTARLLHSAISGILLFMCFNFI